MFSTVQMWSVIFRIWKINLTNVTRIMLSIEFCVVTDRRRLGIGRIFSIWLIRTGILHEMKTNSNRFSLQFIQLTIELIIRQEKQTEMTELIFFFVPEKNFSIRDIENPIGSKTFSNKLFRCKSQRIFQWNLNDFFFQMKNWCKNDFFQRSKCSTIWATSNLFSSCWSSVVVVSWTCFFLSHRFLFFQPFFVVLYATKNLPSLTTRQRSPILF